jgi:transcriptional regulator with XRE-family HTH domain
MGMSGVRAMTFREFLQGEIDKRHMSYTAFADFLGLSTSTITRILDEKNPRNPGLDVLIILAKKTNTSLGVLVEMAYPDVANETRLSPTASVLAQRIENLPQDLRLAIEALIQRGD